MRNPEVAKENGGREMKRKILVEITADKKRCGNCHGVDRVNRFCLFFEQPLIRMDEFAIRLSDCLKAEQEAAK